jgi:hypothetical protein
MENSEATKETKTAQHDLGCGANLTYEFAFVREGKRVLGIDFTVNFLRLAPKDRREFLWRTQTRSSSRSAITH